MSVGSVRSDLDEVPPYVPGRSAAGAIKLSSNEVPGAPLPSVLAAINVAAQAGNRYPDMSCVELTHALAQRLGVDEQDVVVGCGSVSLCTQVVQATCSDGDEVVFAWRSFEAYPILVRVVGAVPVQVPLTTQFGHDLEAMLAVITPRTRVVFLCSPNNPTGTVLRRSELIRFLDAVPAHVVVVRDPEVPDGVGLATGRENLVVLRTFSKAYGLAGLRVGYGYAPTEIAAAIRKVSVPFSVSALAQAAALASLEAADELLQRCDEIALERVRVHKALLTSGFTVPESQANFVWLPLGDDTTAFTEKCTAAGVLVRGFTGAGVRVTIGLPAENDAFLAVALN